MIVSKSVCVFWISFVTASVTPTIATVVCGVVLAAQGLILVIRAAGRIVKKNDLSDGAGNVLPFFSVHVAIHNEPPDLVNETLSALARQTYPDDLMEIIVIDNNTVDPALWVPVQSHCARLGSRFRFMHRDGVKGAKAGALNIALAHIHPEASHIAIIDADYIVTPDFLTEAAWALARTGADYVQFPQAYRRPVDIAEGVDIELEEYFQSDARMADDAEAVLLTGTLCVISRSTLTAVDGWSGRTTTEDAELGVRLCKAGFRGRYIPKVVGKGLLPLTLADLSRQRHRWTSGNFSTLALHLPGLLSSKGRLSKGQAIAIIAQLGAWLNFCLVPAACLLSASLLGRGNADLMTVASLSIVLAFGDIVARLLSRGFTDGRVRGHAISAIATRLALAPAAARATVDACFDRKALFVVTRKSATSTALPADIPLDHLFLFALALMAVFAVSDPALVHSLALTILALPLPAGLWAATELLRYRRSFRRSTLKEIDP